MSNPHKVDHILYFDLFTDSNTNRYWEDAFRSFTSRLVCLNLGRFPFSDVSMYLKKVYDENPDSTTMLHFGGSAKLSMYAPLDLIKQLKSHFPKLRLTAHYGDVYRNSYNQHRAEFFDAIHTTNASNLNNSLSSIYYFPHCINVRWFSEKKFESNQKKRTVSGDLFRVYDFIFAGSPYSNVRIKYLIDVANAFPDRTLAIVGSKWESQRERLPKNVMLLGPKRMHEVVEMYQDARIVLDDPVPDYCKYTSVELNCGHPNEEFHPHYQRAICANTRCHGHEKTYKWFSSRPLHALLSRTPCVLIKRHGQEEVIPHAYYANNTEEVCEQIEQILSHPEKAQALADQGHDHVKQFSFENAIKKLITHNTKRK